MLANVIDLDIGNDTPLGHAKKTHMITTSNGIKVGLIGLGEREWLETINSLPPNLEYRSATAVAKELVPKLQEDGAEVVLVMTPAVEVDRGRPRGEGDGAFASAGPAVPGNPAAANSAPIARLLIVGFRPRVTGS